ncbi:MAG: peptidoglycan-associated lipoprotein Pal [Deltaproteobacteria bacterium]|uniref:peptidoglycan-associated lipoprotein Pal n=1 Tax=Hydrosulfovibrio ferrireducens TaxID=2934181 RepID=UPI0012180C1B|nr:MAG: peptidoglycan-associated lipoprotein Pal [Deltaproteobacteria bacterium]
MKRGILQYLAMACVVVSLSLLSGGCAKKKVQSDKDMAAGTGAGASPAVGQEESLASKWVGGDSGAVLEGRTTAPMLPIYFDYDKSDIRADQKDRIKKNGELLIGSPQVRVRVEGNTDERGTNEYNMALGERRAVTAVKYLVNMGVAEGRIDTLSFGEEKPLNLGHDEMAWSQNRRDDFVIVK